MHQVRALKHFVGTLRPYRGRRIGDAFYASSDHADTTVSS